MKQFVYLFILFCLITNRLIAQTYVRVQNSSAIIVQNGTGFYSNGTITVSSNANLTNNGTLSVNNGTGENGGTYTGKGTFKNGLFNNTGTVALGSSTGCATFSNGFTTSGTLNMKINGAIPCSQFDQLIVTGAATVDGALSINLGFTPTSGQKFQIISATSYIGNFSSILVTPNTFNATYKDGFLTINPASTSCAYRDSLALVDLYNATGGANWIKKWNLALPMTTWFGVTLNAQGCVSCLDLDGESQCNASIGSGGNNLVGTIPASLDSLQSLTTLSLSRNRLTGTIPNFTLPNLTDLSLDSNRLTGAIPNFNLPNLQYLRLYINQLSGSIPNLNTPNLVGLFLFTNQLTGSIPNFNCPNLVSLFLHENQLSGAIPNFNFPKLGVLALRDNKLTGSIPNFNYPSLTNLELYNNQLTGTIPSFNLPKLTIFYLFGNQLTGCIPAEIKTNCPLIGATGGNVSTNTGLNTQSWANYWNNGEGACAVACRTRDSLALVDLYNATGGANWTNKWNLTQPMTTWFGVTLNAQGCVSCIDLDGTADCGFLGTTGNNLVGILPQSMDSLQNLKSIYIQNNKLTGSIPDFNLPNLTFLALVKNGLSGTLPNFSKMPELLDLHIQEAAITGSIPDFNNLPKLQWLEINDSKLSTMPNFSNLPNLFQIDLQFNQLSGVLPSLNNCQKLSSLYLDYNKFTGPIFNFNLPNLQVLGLSNNQLNGNISNLVLPNLRQLYLESNQLTGTIPNFNMPNLNNLHFQKNKIDSCPNFTSLPALKKDTIFQRGLRSFSNKLTFDDILPNIGFETTATFIYTPQDSFFIDTTIKAVIGRPLSIDLKIDGALTTNTYKWFKNGVLQSAYTSNSNKLIISSLQTSDAGVWTCQVINTAAPLLILFSRKITIQVSAQSCRTRDSLALVSLYNSTTGAAWTVRDTLNQKSPWQLQMPITSWFGIRTNATGCVTGIDLDGKLDYEQLGTIPGNNLVGTISSLDSLTSLMGLFLTSNQLRGTIPNFNLPNLQYLALNENLLSGGIPNFNLPNLEYLALTGNNLSGSIPNFDKLPQLKYLYIGNDHLTGTISDFNKLPNLLVLGCGGNSLTGTIPNFSNLSSVATLYLNNNQLTGSIPNFSNLPNLNELILESNQLSGSIPAFNNLPRLGTLYLAKNKLSGCIPTAIKTNCPNIGATGGDVSMNIGLNTQSWANYWNNGEGACSNCTASATPQTLTPSVCLGQTYRSPSGKTFTTAGSKLDTLKNRSGCDSIFFSINLTILSPQNQQGTTQSVCKGDVFRGKILTRDTVFRDTIRSVALCDSVFLTTPVKVNIASVNNLNLSLCAGGSATVNGIVYSAANRSGQQILRAASAAGCDSIINITTSFVANLSAIDDEYTVRDSSNVLNFNVLDNDFYSGNVSVTPLSKPLIGRLDTVGIGGFRYSFPPQANGTTGFSYRLCSTVCPNICDTAEVKIIINRPRLNQDVSLGITPNCGCPNEKLLFPELTLNPDKYPANELTVVSRWGDVVFRAKPYKNDWSGANDAGQVLPAGTYYYIMRLDLANSLIKTGDITIYR
jgi:Leucine-rich repeat (LRR) protein